MKNFTFVLLINFIVTAGYSQTVNVQGTLKDIDGVPLPGVNVIIKGTQVGAVTDLDGQYSLDAPVGSVLVATFIGFLPMEFEVTNTGKAKFINKRNLQNPEKKSPKSPTQKVNYTQPGFAPIKLYDTIDNKHDPNNGVAVMSANTKFKIRNSKSSLDYANLKYKGIHKQRDNDILLFENKSAKEYYMPRILFLSALTIDKVNGLPRLQNTYAQGIPYQGENIWQGPESGSLFSWGPLLSQQEYDGSDYAYDKNGRLVPLFTGNGQKVNAYNPYEFFKQGMQTRNSIRIEHRIGDVEYFSAFKSKFQKGIIPLSDFKRNTFDAGINYQASKIKLSGRYSYSKVNSNHAGSEIIGYHTMKSVLLTPPTFDNSNGFGQKAISNRDAYYTNANEQRSAAVGIIDNPYWLLNNSKDGLNSSHSIYSLDFSYKLFNNTNLNVIVNGNNQTSTQNADVYTGSFIFPNGSFSGKANNLFVNGSQISLNNLGYSGSYFRLAGFLKYHYTTEKAGFESTYSNSYPSQLSNYDSNAYNLNRQTHKVNARLNLNYGDYILFSAQGHHSYYSDIKDANGFIGGVISGGLILSNISAISCNAYFISFCKLYGSYGNDYNATPLISDATQYTSVKLLSSELNSFFPAQQFVSGNALLPENVRTFNLGLDLGFHRNSYLLTINWYNKHTENAVLPDYSSGNEIKLNNLANLRTRGIDLTLNTRHSYYNWAFRNELNFTKYNTQVTDLYNGLQSVPLAGFSFASSNAIEEEPLGVLAGTRYQRDQSGEIIIDENGSPTVDSLKGILADPTPKWTASLFNSIGFRNFEISVIWELKRGGKVWNGTKATLDYFGLSEETGDQRTIQNYVFKGNTIDGVPNTTAVDFANPNNSIEDNRWVRYGVGGVAEDYIEDAGWFRIRSLNASYTFNQRSGKTVKEIKITLSLHNIMLSTNYSGVDPESALFSQPGGSGLDYFNKPSTKSYGLALALTF